MGGLFPARGRGHEWGTSVLRAEESFREGKIKVTINQHYFEARGFRRSFRVAVDRVDTWKKRRKR